VKKISAIVICCLLAICAAQAKPQMYNVKVVKEYPHDVTSYTQGLFFHDGSLYESTGQWGRSSFRKINLNDGKPLRFLKFDKKYFVEGSVMFDDKLYILTWTDKVVFVYDAATLSYRKTCRYPREGWGLTTDGKSLIASDGTSRIYFMDADLNVLRTLKVTLGSSAVKYLNELEWIDGKIWANVYMSDLIYVIDPESGNVESVISCSGLLPASMRTSDTDVLNGIAYDEVNHKIYITGKNWPRLYEVIPVKSVR